MNNKFVLVKSHARFVLILQEKFSLHGLFVYNESA